MGERQRDAQYLNDLAPDDSLYQVIADKFIRETPLYELGAIVLTMGMVNRTLGTHYTIDQVLELPPELIEAISAINTLGKD